MVLSACGASEVPARGAPPAPLTPASPLVAPATAGASSSPVLPAPPAAAASSTSPTPLDPVLVVADPVTLASLAEHGLDLGTALHGARAGSTAELAREAPYRVLEKAVRDDLAEGRRADPSAGVGMRFSHRQLDVRWLASDRTRFDLISVVNRVDRLPFAPGHCGEVRLVYRLAYRTSAATGPVDSRLPMTINVVYYLEPSGNSGCREAAGAWLRPASERGHGDEAAWLISDAGPLSSARRAAWAPKSVELNFQSVRWPSTVRPAMAGHAEYVLRVFHRTPDAPFLVPAPLENTIDSARLARERPLKAELLAWLARPESLRAVDAGMPLVPEKFLSTRAVSVSPHGLARLGNRPYASVLEPGELSSLALSSYDTIGSPEALLRRLDALTCPGCHQSRSIAGFHLLGVEPKEDRVDAVEVPMSPHFHAELARRAPYVMAVAEGRAPDDRRPPAERGARDDGVGARCGLGNAGFAAWTCAPGLRCVPASEPDVGVCIPEAGPGVGDVCEVGTMKPSTNSHRDAIALGAPSACSQGRPCEANSVGFPGGMCSGSCESLPEGAVCGGIPVLDTFNACVGAGTPFEKCIAESTRPGALRSCGFHAPCRDDYVCARAGAASGCMPPYFLFQLRVDGHPI